MLHGTHRGEPHHRLSARASVRVVDEGGVHGGRAERFAQCVDVDRFTVYGNPSDEAREILAGFGPTYLGPWGGFSRLS